MTCADDARLLVASEAARFGVWRRGQDGRREQCPQGLAVLPEAGRLEKRLLHPFTSMQDGGLKFSETVAYIFLYACES